MRAFTSLLTAAAFLAPLSAAAQAVPPETARIVAEGTANSEVMRIAQYLTDVIGPRLTVSPGMRRAEDWTANEKGARRERISTPAPIPRLDACGERCCSSSRAVAVAVAVPPER